MESCYEYLGCQQRDCSMYGVDNGTRCWDVSGTLCNHPGIEFMQAKHGGDKLAACENSGCIYFKEARERGLVAAS